MATRKLLHVPVSLARLCVVLDHWVAQTSGYYECRLDPEELASEFGQLGLALRPCPRNRHDLAWYVHTSQQLFRLRDLETGKPLVLGVELRNGIEDRIFVKIAKMRDFD